MALNKPINDNGYGRIQKYESVLIGHDIKRILEQLDKAILLKTDETYKALLDKEEAFRENTWEEEGENDS